MSKKVLVVDDEPTIVKGLKFSLKQDGYEIEAAYDGKAAIELFEKETFDLVLLDVMLPEMDGMEVLQQIRSASTVPVIMLTAKGDDMDKILGLEYGADDYITKPFNILELKARVKAVLRRTELSSHPTEPDRQNIEVRGLTINLSSRTVKIDGQSINLTAKEFDLLKLFATNQGKVFSRDELLETVWKYDYLGDLRTVDVHIRRLREKIERDPSHPGFISTKWGVGYYFAEN